jgi:hypothetical protein
MLGREAVAYMGYDDHRSPFLDTLKCVLDELYDVLL